MSKLLTEQQNGELIGKWFAYKHMGYNLLLIKASKRQGYVSINYFFVKDENIESIDIEMHENSTIPSITIAYPEGAQMQKEIADCYPVKFSLQKESEIEKKDDCASVAWGPFHPLLQEPVLFRFTVIDEIINQVNVETGYNYRGIEKICVGKKIPEVLELLERISSNDGFSISLAFLHAVEKINHVIVPERAHFLRLIFNELSFLKANLYSLSHLSKCLGLLSDYSDLFRLIKLYNEALSFVTEESQLKDVLVPGGVKQDVSNEAMLQLNVVIQEMVQELSAISKTWEDNHSIANRLSNLGKVGKDTASSMTGRTARAAGISENTRQLSKLPYSNLSYNIPKKEESNCFSRAMLMFEDSLLSLSLIAQAIDKLPHGDVKAAINMNRKGQTIVREPDTYGELAIFLSLEGGIVTELKIRSSSSLNFPFLADCLKGTQINDMPVIISSLEVDFSAMEK